MALLGRWQRLSGSTESFDRASSGARRLRFPVAWACRCHQRGHETCGRRGNVLDGAIKRSLVDLGGRIESAQFPYELQRGVADLFFGRGRLKIEERLDIPA